MRPAGGTEFELLLCPANITAPVMWVPDPTFRWLFVTSYPLFAKGAGVQVLSSKYEVSGVSVQVSALRTYDVYKSQNSHYVIFF